MEKRYLVTCTTTGDIYRDLQACQQTRNLPKFGEKIGEGEAALYCTAIEAKRSKSGKQIQVTATFEKAVQ